MRALLIRAFVLGFLVVGGCAPDNSPREEVHKLKRYEVTFLHDHGRKEIVEGDGLRYENQTVIVYTGWLEAVAVYSLKEVGIYQLPEDSK